MTELKINTMIAVNQGLFCMNEAMIDDVLANYHTYDV
jgi:hypothetical protein